MAEPRFLDAPYVPVAANSNVPEDNPVRREAVRDWAISHGYVATRARRSDGVECWGWTCPEGSSLGTIPGPWSEPPAVPDAMFRAVNELCP